MSLPPASRAAAARLLPGERIDYLFPARLPVAFGGVLVAVTATSVVVLTAPVRRRPRSVFARYPRDTRLGPLDLHGIPSFVLGGRQYEVADAYLAVVNAVDVELAGDAALPPDPLLEH